MGEYYLGFDFGGRSDYNAIVIVEKEERHLRVRYAKAWMEESYTSANLKVHDTYRNYRCNIICLEEVGAGISAVEHLRELGASVLPVKSSDIQETLLNLRALMERREIAISHNMTELIASLNCIEYERTRTGGYAFSHHAGTHDDLGRALALACWAVKSQPSGGVIIKL